MAVPLMVRLEDDLHAKLTEQSRRTHAPMNRIINDALRLMFSGAFGQDPEAFSERPHIIATFTERIRKVQAAANAFNVPQEDLRGLQTVAANLFNAILDCEFATMAVLDPSLAPIASTTSDSEHSTSSHKEVRA